MPRPERIMFAFGAFGKSRKTAGRTQRVKPVFPAGEQLMHIALMSDIPDYMIVRAVENAVKRYRKLDDAEIGSEVSASAETAILRSNYVDKLFPYLSGKCVKFGVRKRPEILRFSYTVKNILFFVSTVHSMTSSRKYRRRQSVRSSYYITKNALCKCSALLFRAYRQLGRKNRENIYMYVYL